MKSVWNTTALFCFSLKEHMSKQFKSHLHYCAFKFQHCQRLNGLLPRAVRLRRDGQRRDFVRGRRHHQGHQARAQRRRRRLVDGRTSNGKSLGNDRPLPVHRGRGVLRERRRFARRLLVGVAAKQRRAALVFAAAASAFSHDSSGHKNRSQF